MKSENEVDKSVTTVDLVAFEEALLELGHDCLLQWVDAEPDERGYIAAGIEIHPGRKLNRRPLILWEDGTLAHDGQPPLASVAEASPAHEVAEAVWARATAATMKPHRVVGRRRLAPSARRRGPKSPRAAS